MDIREAFASQIEATKLITEESVDALLERRHEAAAKYGVEDTRTDDEIRAMWPIGDKALYALVDRWADEENEVQPEETGSALDARAGVTKNRVLEVVRVLESELDQFAENHVLTHLAGDVPGQQMPRFYRKD